jgi:sugar phosphate isomerase/epimerase
MKASGAAITAACVGADRLLAKRLDMPIGLQLYSVRDLLPKDFDGTLHKLREIGYTEVEAAGYYDRTAAEFRLAMDQAGLRCVSTHHALAPLRQHMDEFIDFGNKLGLEYLICSSSQKRDPTARGPLTLDDWHYTADEFNRIGAKVKAAGMTFGYHNHIPEFGKENGVVFYDELLRLTDPKYVVFEMDCGWVEAAGRHPLEWIAKMPERFPLLHIKDLEKTADGKNRSAILGRGTMDYRPILRAATGLKHYFIEQEEFDMDPIESLRLDAEYMRRLDF